MLCKYLFLKVIFCSVASGGFAAASHAQQAVSAYPVRAVQGYEPEAGTPQHLGDMIKSALARYGKLVISVGMKAE